MTWELSNGRPAFCVILRIRQLVIMHETYWWTLIGQSDLVYWIYRLSCLYRRPASWASLSMGCLLCYFLRMKNYTQIVNAAFEDTRHPVPMHSPIYSFYSLLLAVNDWPTLYLHSLPDKPNIRDVQQVSTVRSLPVSTWPRTRAVTKNSLARSLVPSRHQRVIRANATNSHFAREIRHMSHVAALDWQVAAGPAISAAHGNSTADWRQSFMTTYIRRQGITQPQIPVFMFKLHNHINCN